MSSKQGRLGALISALILGVGSAACGGTAVTPDAGTTATTGGGTGGGGGGGGSGCWEGSTGGSSGSGGAGPAAPLVCEGPGPRYATHAVSACFGGGETFGQEAFPAPVLGPPKGDGCCSGSLDVVSLGDGGTVTLTFDGNAIVDGPGPDFLVFENAFDIGNDPMHPFAELGTVEVSDDGVSFVAFPCTAKAYPYGSCAGWHAVYGNLDDGVDPLDPAVAGGDPFDLADLGVHEARFVRITDRADMPGSFDLDAIAILHPACP
ncbi:MAG: hypothetical protein U0359_08920 [Byssovorax sp.]